MAQLPTVHFPATTYGLNRKIRNAIKARVFRRTRSAARSVKSSFAANQYWGIVQGKPSIRWMAYAYTELGDMSQAHALQALQKEQSYKVKGKMRLIYEEPSPGKILSTALRLAYDAGEPDLKGFIDRRKGLKACLKAILLHRIPEDEMVEAMHLYSGIMNEGWKQLFGKPGWQNIARDSGVKNPA